MSQSKRMLVRRNRRHLTAEPLEMRCLLAASFGWDGPGLGSATLTYTIRNAPSSLTQSQADAAIESALDVWSNVADITFSRVDRIGLGDSIDISFTPLDGSGGTLAQAYFPDDVNPARIAGDIQFDLSETWEVGNSLGTGAFDLTWVAVHEIGHALGLNHSDQAGSVLRASVSPNQQFTALDSADVASIRQLYSSADQVTNTDSTAAEVPDNPIVDNPTTNNGGTTNNRFTNWWNWFRGGNWWRWFGRIDGDAPSHESPPTVSIPPSTTQSGGETESDCDDVTDRVAMQLIATDSVAKRVAVFKTSASTVRQKDNLYTVSEIVESFGSESESDFLRQDLDRVFAEFGRQLQSS